MITRIPLMAAHERQEERKPCGSMWRGGSQKIDHRQMPNAPEKAKKDRGTKW
jgi:hypothetical protein